MRESQQEPLIIPLLGDWDLARKDELGALLSAAYDHPQVVLDLTETRYMDSTALAELAKMRKHRVNHRGFEPTHIVVRPGNIEKLLTIVGFDKAFPLFPSLPEALAAFDDPGDRSAQEPSSNPTSG